CATVYAPGRGRAFAVAGRLQAFWHGWSITDFEVISPVSSHPHHATVAWSTITLDTVKPAAPSGPAGFTCRCASRRRLVRLPGSRRAFVALVSSAPVSSTRLAACLRHLGQRRAFFAFFACARAAARRSRLLAPCCWA